MAREWKGAIFKAPAEYEQNLLGSWQLTADEAALAQTDDEHLIFATTPQELYAELIQRYPDLDVQLGQIYPPRDHDYRLAVHKEAHYLGEVGDGMDVERVRALARRHGKIELGGGSNSQYLPWDVVRHKLDCADVVLHGTKAVCNPKLAKAKKAKRDLALVTTAQLKGATYALLESCKQSGERAALLAGLVEHYSGTTTREVIREFFGTVHFYGLLQEPRARKSATRKHPSIVAMQRDWARNPEGNAAKYREALADREPSTRPARGGDWEVEIPGGKGDAQYAEELMQLMRPIRARR